MNLKNLIKTSDDILLTDGHRNKETQITSIVMT